MWLLKEDSIVLQLGFQLNFVTGIHNYVLVVEESNLCMVQLIKKVYISYIPYLIRSMIRSTVYFGA